MSVTHVVSCTPGVAEVCLGKGAGNASGAADVGVAGLNVRVDALAPLTSAVGAYSQTLCDSLGRVHVAGDATISGDALIALEATATATTVTVRGSYGNLMDGVVVTVPNTSSNAIDVSAAKRATITIVGSVPASTSAYDVYVSHDSGTGWVLASSLTAKTFAGNGVALVDRQTYADMSVAGVSWLKIVAHDSETVTASCFTD